MGLDQFSLDGRVALVTGASSGIGYGVARGLAHAGASIVAAARRLDRLEELVTKIEADGGEALAVRIDVTDRDSIRTALDQAEDRFGGVDIVINSAGVADPKPFLKIDEESLDYTMDTNFKGAWHVGQEAARRMVEAKRPGSIINISSILGSGAQSGYSAYCSSKGAVTQLTRSMALDLGRYGIRVNAIAPGWFITEMNEDHLTSEKGQAYLDRTPARRAGKVEELVGPIVLLASQAGSFVNGAVLPVDGAHSAAVV
ncbi:MAG: SDR family oxidoreductase [Deltaproteobacteria bacterium]|nr:SDR family oxidoreductase [Deltaproteobacteria bacterium]